MLLFKYNCLLYIGKKTERDNKEENKNYGEKSSDINKKHKLPVNSYIKDNDLVGFDYANIFTFL